MVETLEALSLGLLGKLGASDSSLAQAIQQHAAADPAKLVVVLLGSQVSPGACIVSISR